MKPFHWTRILKDKDKPDENGIWGRIEEEKITDSLKNEVIIAFEKKEASNAQQPLKK